MELDASFDMLISIGGDGTMLRAATLAGNSGIPLLGVNAGRLGFLASVQKENIANFLQLVIEKKYTISQWNGCLYDVFRKWKHPRT